MKIYLSGGINGNYRAQNIIKALGDAGISFCYNPDRFYTPEIKKKWLRVPLSFLFLILAVPLRLLLIAISSHVVVLPMTASVGSLLDAWVGRLLGKRILVDFYISQHDTIVNDRNIVGKNSVRATLLLLKDKLFMKVAHKVIFLNRSEAEYYQRVAGVTLEEAKVAVIPLCVDYRKEAFFSNRIEDGSFDICWWGTYIPLHGLEILIRAFSFIDNKEIRLHIFGDSDEKAVAYAELVERLGLAGRVQINNGLSFSSGTLGPFLSARCDIAIGNFGASEKAKTVLVNKVVDALSLGIPCLTMRTQATVELFPLEEGLIFADPHPETIAEKIERCFYDRSVLAAIGKAGKRKYLECFSPDVFRANLLALLNE
jgi:glycosyltransferase involved in cell wall biosynthesis